MAIARALVLEPRAVLLYEPLSNLNVGLKRELLNVFRDLLKERRMTALYVTQDLRGAAALGDRLAVMEAGASFRRARWIHSVRTRRAISCERWLRTSPERNRPALDRTRAFCSLTVLRLSNNNFFIKVTG